MSCWFWRSYYLTDTSEFRPPSLVRCWFIKIIQNTISNSLFDRSWDLRGFSTFTSFEHKGKPHFILWSVFLWKIISNPNISFMPDVTFEYKRNNFDRSELKIISAMKYQGTSLQIKQVWHTNRLTFGLLGLLSQPKIRAQACKVFVWRNKIKSNIFPVKLICWQVSLVAGNWYIHVFPSWFRLFDMSWCMFPWYTM